MGEMARSFKDLIVWQKSHELVLEIYKLTNNFPKTEIYCLTSQIRRAAISIPANIAEGFNRTGKLDKLRFLNIAHSSLEECRYYLILINDLNYGDVGTLKSKLEEVSKMLYAYSNKIKTSKC